ncbi:M23 family metallopeptidase [Arthrobacter sp. PAMC25564]|uniref:M23 family metallopeptidase n=1 Tax=Arthrobacter sp. PAMC25564 TaxID=2565366 RepID=UPI001447D7CD|nr:M23 family metallopeptidase [Arthrobacter sp. PAMC25564]
MGKHWGNSSSEQSIRARTMAVRWLSGVVCLALAVLAVGIQGLGGTLTQAEPAAFPASGVVGPGTLDASAPGTARGTAATAAAPAFTADALAIVAFARSTVETTSKAGGGGLNVASAGMKRPPLGSLMAPLETLVPTSPYGLRISPLTGTAGEFHWGQDYAAACGTRVYAADTGVVRAVGWHPWGGGNRVEIDHGNGLITTYNHLEAIAVKKGDSVQVGQVIARVGTTGSSTGCHLHFETILNGAHTDPLGWAMIPIHQVDQLGTIDMVSYEPDAGKASNASLGWAIPVRTDLTHVVAGGVQEQTVAATAAAAAAAPTASAAASEAAAAPPSQSAAVTPTPSVTKTPSVKPTPTPSVTKAPSATVPPTPAAPAPTPAAPAPTPSVTPTPGATTLPAQAVPSTMPPAPPAATAPPTTQAATAPPTAPPAVQPPVTVAPKPAAPPAPTGAPAPQPLATNTTKPTASLAPTPDPTTTSLP